MIDIKALAIEILEKGVYEKIHDIYILPYMDGYKIDFRRGNCFFHKREIAKEIGGRLIIHFKFNGGMNVSEKRRAQLGAMSVEILKERRRLRLSTAGDYCHRESLVIRYLHKSGLDSLNFFSQKEIKKAHAISHKRGLHLFCGPVGSGKTTLMYELCHTRKKRQQIIAIEDPVELIDENILQFQINEMIEMDYDALIKLCLRHRPDIMIVGEIRDEKTAKAVVRAALTGHTVFSTIHAGSVQGIFKRLFDLNVSEVDLLECLCAIYFQRLVIGINEEACVLLDVVTEQDKWQGEWNLKLQRLLERGAIDDDLFDELLEEENS
ncbi:MAG: Flp pilus assembly complex ATPase component TadA [Streptococcaceae bacterium]|nr:Flp pilus assembly complex ATPase component TadA [Streptococcaceae bacterium]